MLRGRERRVTPLGSASANIEDGPHGPRGLVYGENLDLQAAFEESRAATLWLSHAIRSCGDVKAAGFNRRMRKTARPVV